jgi:hypothetical protein
MAGKKKFTDKQKAILDEDEKLTGKIYRSGQNGELIDEKLTRKIYGSDQIREISVINESGLYTLILRSHKKQAKDFRKWVTSEVLPQIRREGCYTMPTNNHPIPLGQGGREYHPGGLSDNYFSQGNPPERKSEIITSPGTGPTSMIHSPETGQPSGIPGMSAVKTEVYQELVAYALNKLLYDNDSQARKLLKKVLESNQPLLTG